ncbi:MAG: PEP-CTERM sorting domain-containing protein, partial [Candidatus Nealsonbacteria bacterium]|nr:PEP-CTERM sorting domain-containing protein [Candidatus Nealsonbacteria bacterium]
MSLIRKVGAAALCLAFSVGFSQPAEAIAYKVFLLGGQSNIVGRGATSELPPELRIPQPDVLLYEGGTLASLAPRSSEFGPEVTFGRTVADAFPDDDYALIKYGTGGSNLHAEWDPVTGSHYSTFRTTVTNGLAALQSGGNTTEIVGMLWAQGERDAKDDRTTAQYQDDLTEFIGDVRTRYGTELPFYISRLSILQTNISPAQLAQIRPAQANVAAGDANAYMIDTDTYGMKSDNLHFNAAGQMALGIGFAAALADPVVDPPDPPVTPGVIAHWSFDADFTDASPSGNDLSVAASDPAVTATAGDWKFGGGAADLDGDDWLSMASTLDFTATDQWSVAFWGKRRAGAEVASGMVIGEEGTLGNYIWTPDVGSNLSTGGLRFSNGTNNRANFDGIADDQAYHHWVVTADGTGNVEAYRDGTSLGTESPTDGTALTASDVGHACTLARQVYNGQIDELYVFDESIDAGVAKYLYLLNENRGLQLLADLTDDDDVTVADWLLFKPNYLHDLSALSELDAYCAGDLDGDGDNDLHDFGLFKDAYNEFNGPEAFTAMAASVPEPGTGLLLVAGGLGVFALRRRRKSITKRRAGKMAASCVLVGALLMLGSEPAMAGVLAHWSFDTDFTDSSAAGNDLSISLGTPNVTPTASEWKFGGGAANFTATTADAEHLALDTPIDFGASDPWSVSFWGRRRAGTHEASGMILGDLTSRDFIWTPDVGSAVSNGGLRFRNSSGANGDFGNMDDDNQYHHWAVIADGNGNVTCYRDNVSKGTVSATTTFQITNVGHAYNATKQSYNGQIDELYIFDEALTAAAVSGLFLHNDPGNSSPELLELSVDVVVGAIAMSNDVGNALDRDVDLYQITSDGNSLDPGGWLSLQQRGYDGGNTDPNDGIGWEEMGTPATDALAEANLSGSSTFNPGTSVSLGTAYDTGIDAQDLVFTYRLVDGSVVEGLVEYVSTGMTWDGGEFDWADAKWNSGHTPVAGADMLINADTNDSVVTVVANFISAGSVTVGANNTATLIIADTKTLEVTGAVTVGASAMLTVDGTLTAGTATVAGTLAGSGTINADPIDVTGTVAPGGDGIGTLTVGSGELGLDSAAAFNAQVSLAVVEPGQQIAADRIEVSAGGVLMLGGTLAVSGLGDRASADNWTAAGATVVVKELLGDIGQGGEGGEGHAFTAVTPEPNPAAPPHLGQGAFLRGVNYVKPNPDDAPDVISSVEIDLFVALGGDADG